MTRTKPRDGRRRAIAPAGIAPALPAQPPQTRRALLGSVCIFALAATAGTAYGNPTGGTVVAGQVTIGQPSSTQLTIQQTSPNAAINWQSFNIAKGEKTTIDQPSSSDRKSTRLNSSHSEISRMPSSA